MNDILFEVLKAVTVLVIVLLTRYAVPWIKQQVENTKYAWIIQCTELAVRSAEQTILGSKTGAGEKGDRNQIPEGAAAAEKHFYF